MRSFVAGKFTEEAHVVFGKGSLPRHHVSDFHLLAST
jgi:hypothetical protein